jgi:hypothetical protein
LIDRVRETLRADQAAQPDARAVARVLSTVWAAPRPSPWRRMLDAWRLPTFSRLGVLATAAATLLVGVLVGDSMVKRAPVAEPMAASGVPTGEYPVQFATNVAGERLVPTQFILDDATARRVSIVGDFNDWKAGDTPLTRLANGVWTATVPLTAGRHVYAFVLDDTLVVADPRATKVVDADYGREGSVVMVFAP